MADKKIKVVGYAKKVLYNSNIEYRNYSDNLVGNQFASDGGTSLFTAGNFEITTNVDPKLTKTYTKNKLSKFYTLGDMNLTESEVKEFRKKTQKINSDPTKLKNYAYFGSLVELIKATLTSIKETWPASLYVQPILGSTYGNTFQDYSYNTTTDKATFKVSTNFISNNFDLNFTSADLPSKINIKDKYVNYVIDVGGSEYKIIGFTGSTTETDDHIYLQTKGDAFTGATTGYTTYHVKPSSVERSKFFNNLNDISSTLLNRDGDKPYTIVISYQKETERGSIIDTTRKIIWPLADDYNIAIVGSDYSNYYNTLINIAEEHDRVQGDIINRQFVTNAINDFDKLPRTDGGAIENDAERVKELLNIYGRGFDEDKKPIDSLRYQRNVTYDKKDNPSDNLINHIVSNLGWNSVTQNEVGNLFEIATPNNAIFSGQSKGYSKKEVDIEFWRRIVINTAWMWKSKGTRKGVEFLFKLLGIPDSLIKINEHIYVVEDKIDFQVLDKTLDNMGYTGLTTDFLPIDNDGYPSPLPNSSRNYYQSFGKWWRTTGGLNPTVDELDGNNPHNGGYDGGNAYINSFRKFIPDWEPTTFTEQTLKESNENLFVNYNYGKIDGVHTIGCAIPTQTYLNDLVINAIVETESRRSGTITNSAAFGYPPCTATTAWSIVFYKNGVVATTQSNFYTGHQYTLNGVSTNTTTASTETISSYLKTGFEDMGLIYQDDGVNMVIESSGCTATDKFKYEICIDTTINCGSYAG